jgi:hypothetical protein
MMKRLCLAAVILLAVAACSSTSPHGQAAEAAQPAAPAMPAGMEHISYAGGDGADCSRAVVIRGAKNEMEGIRAENIWILWVYPGARKTGQSLVQRGGGPHDVIRFVTAGGEEGSMCFDISGFFGKW